MGTARATAKYNDRCRTVRSRLRSRNRDIGCHLHHLLSLLILLANISAYAIVVGVIERIHLVIDGTAIAQDAPWVSGSARGPRIISIVVIVIKHNDVRRSATRRRHGKRRHSRNRGPNTPRMHRHTRKTSAASRARAM
jgi:hypothetical protein